MFANEKIFTADTTDTPDADRQMDRRVWTLSKFETGQDFVYFTGEEWNFIGTL